MLAAGLGVTVSNALQLVVASGKSYVHQVLFESRRGVKAKVSTQVYWVRSPPSASTRSASI